MRILNWGIVIVNVDSQHSCQQFAAFLSNFVIKKSLRFFCDYTQVSMKKIFYFTYVLRMRINQFMISFNLKLKDMQIVIEV